VGDISDVFPTDPLESADADGDGIGNNADQNDASVVTPTVIIEGIDSGVVNSVDANGITLADLILEASANCASSLRNHGQYVSCMSKYLNSLKKAGIITGAEKKKLQNATAETDIGKKPGNEQSESNSRSESSVRQSESDSGSGKSQSSSGKKNAKRGAKSGPR
jgi:cobalamin biosynthesis Mg chelatase CobN